MRVYKNRIPMKIFGPKREKVKEGYSKLHDKTLHDLYYSSHIISNKIKDDR
jgi:hypothetical protein